MSSAVLDDLDAAFDDDDEDDYETDGNTSVDTSTGYGAAALAYRDRGWRSVLPLPRGKKFPPPTGYTGDGATVPSYPDVHAWTEDHPTSNVALVLPDGVIGIDVDAYVGKHGAVTVAAAEVEWGALPPTVRSTARDDGATAKFAVDADDADRKQACTTGECAHSAIVKRQRASELQVIRQPLLACGKGRTRCVEQGS